MDGELDGVGNGDRRRSKREGEKVSKKGQRKKAKREREMDRGHKVRPKKQQQGHAHFGT